MFASWSAGEYGSVGATEWLEVRLARFQKQARRAAALIHRVGVYSGLPVVSEHEGLRLHRPGRSHSRYLPQGSCFQPFSSLPFVVLNTVGILSPPRSERIQSGRQSLDAQLDPERSERGKGQLGVALTCPLIPGAHASLRLPSGGVSKPGRLPLLPICQRQLGVQHVSVAPHVSPPLCPRCPRPTHMLYSANANY